MKKLLAITLLATGLMAGCMDPIPAMQNTYSPSQVNMSDTWLQQRVLLTIPKPERVGAGQLKVTVELYNRTGDDISVDYKYFFTDKSGTQIDQGVQTGWEFVRVPAHGRQSFSYTSMSAAAEDFHVDLRGAK